MKCGKRGIMFDVFQSLEGGQGGSTLAGENSQNTGNFWTEKIVCPKERGLLAGGLVLLERGKTNYYDPEFENCRKKVRRNPAMRYTRIKSTHMWHRRHSRTFAREGRLTPINKEVSEPPDGEVIHRYR